MPFFRAAAVSATLTNSIWKPIASRDGIENARDRTMVRRIRPLRHLWHIIGRAVWDSARRKIGGLGRFLDACQQRVGSALDFWTIRGAGT